MAENVHHAGPIGVLVAFVIVGVFVFVIMEGNAEMIGHWPVSNPMTEFVNAFVDEDLAIVIGLVQWYDRQSCFHADSRPLMVLGLSIPLLLLLWSSLQQILQGIGIGQAHFDIPLLH